MSDTDMGGPTWDAVTLRGIAAHAVDRAERAEAERDSLMRATWSAYVETGADTDGDNQWHCSPEMAGKTLVSAVRELAKDYDDALREGDKWIS